MSDMPNVYSSKQTAVHPASLDDEALLAIGRIVRATAEIEDLVNLFICNLAGISESKMVVMLGKTAISKRIEIAEYLAKIASTEATELASWAFDAGFRDLMTCRNVVSHGVLLGKDEDGMWAFLTSNMRPPEGQSAIQLVASYSTDTLQRYAGAAEAAIPPITTRLELEAHREARHERPLSPHRKSQPRSGKGAKPQRPSQSSQE